MQFLIFGVYYCSVMILTTWQKRDSMNDSVLLGVIILIIAAIAWLLWMLTRREFFREMQFLNMEIARTKGEERKEWIRQRRRLLLTMIPFVPYKK